MLAVDVVLPGLGRDFMVKNRSPDHGGHILGCDFAEKRKNLWGDSPEQGAIEARAK